MRDAQKLKPLYIRDYLLRYSDEAHPVTLREILDWLRSQGVNAERKSVYDDLEALRQYGVDVVRTQAGRYAAYFIGERTFQLPELKLLADSVQSSRFITRKKTASLIRKIESLGSVHQARQLQRQVLVADRIKQMNESIYYNVDEIHSGISQNRQIRFRYFRYTVRKTKEYRRGGSWYQVSPYALTWDNENYYLVAYDEANRGIRHYRVDKMERIKVTEKEREGQAAFKALDMGNYSRSVFGMFSGETVPVTLRFSDELVGAVLDRLGQDAVLTPEGEKAFRVTAEVAVSPQFFAWVFGFGTDARILGPEEVRVRMGEYTEAVAVLYRPGETAPCQGQGKEV